MKLLLRLFLLGTMLATAFTARAGGVIAENPYVRAVPPGQPVSAAFLVLHNPSGKPLALVAARSDVAEAVELHTHLQQDGMMKMRQVEKIEIPAGGATELRPGSYHIMLIHLKRRLNPGDIVDFELEFDDGSTLAVHAPVKKIGMGMMMHQPQQGGGMGGMSR